MHIYYHTCILWHLLSNTFVAGAKHPTIDTLSCTCRPQILIISLLHPYIFYSKRIKMLPCGGTFLVTFDTLPNVLPVQMSIAFASVGAAPAAPAATVPAMVCG